MAQAFFGGVHPNDMKAATNEKAIEQLEAPAEVVIPMSMHIGAPCKPIVAVGDKVTIGQKIGEPGGFVSAPIHASVSGTVKAVEPRPFSMGGTMMSVVIENDFQNTVCPDIHPVEDPDSLTPEQLVEIVKNAGIVGQGGATFPTHVKLSVPPGKKAEFLIINGVECEPYLTSDHRTMLEKGEELMVGTTILMRALGVKQAQIGIENNKPEAIKKLTEMVKDEPKITVCPLLTKYPQGGERSIIYAVTGRKVNSSMLPADAGCIVDNIDTVASIYNAVCKTTPLIRKIITVTGDAIAEPQNFEVRLGTNYQRLVEAAGGFKQEPEKMISGGPMMGQALFSLDFPVAKTSSALTTFTKDQVAAMEPSACIRCGRCVGVCPEHLVPPLMMKASTAHDLEKFQSLNGMECVECGCCAYACPARRPLTQAFKEMRKAVAASRRK